jgi:hypothetical protein
MIPEDQLPRHFVQFGELVGSRNHRRFNGAFSPHPNSVPQLLVFLLMSELVHITATVNRVQDAGRFVPDSAHRLAAGQPATNNDPCTITMMMRSTCPSGFVVPVAARVTG